VSNKLSALPEPSPLQGNATQDIEYIIDEHDLMTWVNEAWDDFALCNDAPNLLSAQVLGRDWREFVQGDTNRMYMEAMLSAARILGKRIGQSYRCDSPSDKRYVKLTVEPQEKGHIKFRHHTTKVVPQKYIVNFVVPKTPVKGGKVAFRCSMCNRVKLQGQWMEVEDAVDSKLIAAGSTVSVYYAICPSCHSKVKRISSTPANPECCG